MPAMVLHVLELAIRQGHVLRPSINAERAAIRAGEIAACDKPSCSVEGDQAFVKEMIGSGRQQQPVVAVETFLVRVALCPGLDVTGQKKSRIVDGRQKASTTSNALDARPEEPLSSTSLDKGNALRVVQSLIVFDFVFDFICGRPA